MASLLHRRNSIAVVSGNKLAPGASYSITAFRAGAQVHTSGSATPLRVRKGHGFSANDKFFKWPGAGAVSAASVRTITSIATGATYDDLTYTGSSISVDVGDTLINLGPDSASNGSQPSFDGSPLSIYTYMDGTTAYSNETVTSGSDGEYSYWHRGMYSIWELVRTGAGALADFYEDAYVAGENQPALRYANEWATAGNGTSASPWTGWNSALLRGDLPELRVHFPAGVYSTSTRLEIYDRTTLTGDGAISQIQISGNISQVSGENNGILVSANSGGASLYSLDSPGYYVRISGLRIYFNTYIAYAAIRLIGISEVQIRDVFVDGTGSDTGNSSTLGLFGISIGDADRVTVSGCHVSNLLHGSNSNGISVAGENSGDYEAGTSYSITNNVITNLGTIGINIGMGSVETVVVSGNTVNGAAYGIDLEGTSSGSCRNVTVSGNTLIGKSTPVTGGDLSNRSLDWMAIVVWARNTTGTDTSLRHYNIHIDGNTIKDYSTALATVTGEVAFTNNQVYNWGNYTNFAGSTNRSQPGISIGYVFAYNDLSNILIEGNYFSQITSAASNSTSNGCIRINNNGLGAINNVIIRNNVINGMDAATTPTNYGIYVQTPGSNWDISGDYFRGTKNVPIYVSVSAMSPAPSSITNWRIADNFFLDCNAGGSASPTIQFLDTNNYTWTKMAVMGNVVFDANNKTTYLLSQTGTGWSGAIWCKGNVVSAGAAYVGLTSLISRNNFQGRGLSSDDSDSNALLAVTTSGASYTAEHYRNTTFMDVTTDGTLTALTLQVPGSNEDGRILTVKHASDIGKAFKIANSGSMRMIGDWEPYGFHDSITFQAKGGIWFEQGRADVSTKGVRLTTETGITASTTQTQGQGQLTYELNNVATCANANDTVTLPPAWQGRRCVVINNGAATLKIFPSSGDNLGTGVNTSTTIATTEMVTFLAYDNTNWRGFKATKV